MLGVISVLDIRNSGLDLAMTELLQPRPVSAEPVMKVIEGGFSLPFRFILCIRDGFTRAVD